MGLRNRKPTQAPVWAPEGRFVMPHFDGTYDQPTVKINAPTARELVEGRDIAQTDAEQLTAHVAEDIGATAVQSSEQ